MDTGHHELANLFEALGLPPDVESIEHFLAKHTLIKGEPIAQAPFWSQAQAEFLQTALDDDAEWAEAVDELATLLSKG